MRTTTKVAPRRAALGRSLGAALLLALGTAARGADPVGPALASASSPGAAPVPAPLLRACGTPRVEPGRTLDLDAEHAAIEAMQLNHVAGLLERVCAGWSYAWLVHGSDSDAAVKWSSGVASALVWQRKSGEALEVLDAIAPRVEQAAPRHPGLALESPALRSFIHMNRGEWDQALDWSGRAMAVLEATSSALPRHQRVTLQINHATLLSTRRKYEEAVPWFDRALAEARVEPPIHELLAATMDARAILERRRERFDDAFDWTRRAIDYRKTHFPQDVSRQGAALSNAAVLLMLAGRLDEAEQWLHEAISTGDRDPRPQADINNLRSRARDQLAALLLARGRLDEAAAVARQALDLTSAGPQAGTAFEVRPLSRWARIQLARGDYTSALATWRLALERMAPHSERAEPETRHDVWSGYARTLLELGDVLEAERAAQRAVAELALWRPQAVERANTLRLVATLAQRRGDVAGARARLDEADAVVAPLLAEMHALRVDLAAQRCALGTACDALQQRLIDGGDALPPAVHAHAALSLARHERLAGRLDRSEGWSKRALATAAGSSQPWWQWQALAEQSRIAQAAGRADEAILFGKLALATLERLRASAAGTGPGADARYVEDKAGLYRELADALFARARIAEGLEVLALLKRHEQGEYHLRSGSDAGAGPAFTRTEQALRERVWAALASEADTVELDRLVAAEAAQRLMPAEAERLRALRAQQARRRAAVEARLDAVFDAVRAELAAAETTSPTPPMAAAAALAAESAAVAGRPLPPRTLRAWLLAHPTHVTAVWHDARGWRVQSLATGTALGTRIGQALARIQGGDVAAAELRALHEALGRALDAAAAYTGATRIELWLDGALRYLPFSALHDGARYLAQKYTLAVMSPVGLPSAATRRVAGDAAPQVRAFGVTRADAGLPGLPAVARELCGIVGGPVRGLTSAEGRAAGCRSDAALRGQGPLDGEADLDAFFTRRRFEQAAQHVTERQVLHVGTHFVLRPGNAARSWLLLGDGSRLSLEELARLSMGRSALVTLSACDGARPVEAAAADGREIDALPAALLKGGARGVLASLWRVDDDATARFMQGFYRELAHRPDDPALALQRTQQRWIAAGGRDALPRHWAAFTLTSAPR